MIRTVLQEQNEIKQSLGNPEMGNGVLAGTRIPSILNHKLYTVHRWNVGVCVCACVCAGR